MPPIDQTDDDANQDQLDTSGDGDVGAGAQVDEEADPGPADSEGGTVDEEETVITLGDDAPAEEAEEAEAAAAPAWVRDVRKTNRELVRKTREQEAEIARLKGADDTAATPAAIVVGEKPTFESCAFDPDKFEAELTAWNKRKADAEAQQTAAVKTREAEEKNWRTRVDAVEGAAAKLKVRDPEGAVLAFEGTFSVLQRGIIMGAPEDAATSAALRFALGSNPARAKALASIADPIKFAMKLADEIKEMKMTTRKPAPVPERRVAGNVAGAAAVDNTLNRLREEAAKTGNHSKVIAYKNEQRKKAARAA
jgi:hypothetical protein